MKIKEKFNKLPHKKLITTALVVIAIFVLGWLGYLWYKSATVNYAQEVARPIEEGLVRAGGIKCKSTGDAGRGVDNRTPWYKEYIAMPAATQETMLYIQNITASQGYRLIHADVNNRGPIDVADRFVEEWYYDDHTKDSPYQDLNQGNIVLKVALNENGSANACEGVKGVSSDNTLVSISVRLPNYK